MLYTPDVARSLWLALVATVPSIAVAYGGFSANTAAAFGGTSILIVCRRCARHDAADGVADDDAALRRLPEVTAGYIRPRRTPDRHHVTAEHVTSRTARYAARSARPRAARRRQGHPGQATRRERGIPQSRPATCSALPWRRHRAGAAGQADLRPGRPRPRRPRVALIRERLYEDDTAVASSSTAFRARSRRPRRSTRCCMRSDRRHRLRARVPARPRRGGRPPARPRRDESAATTRRRRSGTACTSTGARRSRSSPTTSRAASRGNRRGRCATRRMRSASSTSSLIAEQRADRDRPQIRARDREDGTAPAVSWSRCSSAWARSSSRAHDSRARSGRREAYPRARRHADLQGLQRLSRPPSAPRRTRWSCTGSPAAIASRRAT